MAKMRDCDYKPERLKITFAVLVKKHNFHLKKIMTTYPGILNVSSCEHYLYNWMSVTH